MRLKRPQALLLVVFSLGPSLPRSHKDKKCLNSSWGHVIIVKSDRNKIYLESGGMLKHSKDNTQGNRSRLYILGGFFVFVILAIVFHYIWNANQDDQGQDQLAETEVSQSYQETNGQEASSEASDQEGDQVKDEKTEVRISLVGDVMVHGPQLEAAYDEVSGQYDFAPTFAPVAPLIEESDLALANLETTLPGEEFAYTGYPLFASPDSLVDALQEAGFDGLFTVNNHCLDTGVQGLERTAQVVEDKGMDAIGTFQEPDQARVLHKDIEGIKVAILAYTEMVNPSQFTTESPEDMAPYLNLLSEDQILADLEEVEEDTDFTLAYVHWGEEYADQLTANQVHYAQFLAEAGVDAVIGSHPHVIQETEVIEGDQEETFVLYSMGNFASNQRVESLGQDYAATEDGIIVSLNLVKDPETGQVDLASVDYDPTWVWRYEEGDQYAYRVLPIESALEEDLPPDVVSRMEASYQRSLERLEPKADQNQEAESQANPDDPKASQEGEDQSSPDDQEMNQVA